MFKLNISVFALTILGCVRSQSQLATLYESTGCTGPSTSINANYVPDFSKFGFENRARSVRLVGVWLFYDNKDYNQRGDAAMEYVFEPAITTCVNFQALGGTISSARFSGNHLDYRSPTITFYETTFFQELDEYLSNDRPNLNLNDKIKSLIVTGHSSQGWTLYDRPNYGGYAVCVFPPPSNNFEPAFITDTRSISIPHNTIASVRFGCHGGKTRVAAFTAVPIGTHVV